MTDQTANLAQAMRDANTGEAWAAEQGIPFGRFAQAAVDQLVAAGWQPPEDDPSDADAVQDMLDDATRAFADAGTSSERVEVIRDLLAGWYAAWPASAVTDEHEGIAHQIVALVYAAEARASTPAAEPVDDRHDHTTGFPTFAPDAELVVDTSDGPQQWTGARWNDHVHAATRAGNSVPERLVSCPPSVCTTTCPANPDQAEG